jgi:hypothetical protein
VLALAVLVAPRLIGMLGLAVVRTAAARRRHRELLDILATPWPAMVGARVLAHPAISGICTSGGTTRRSCFALVLADPWPFLWDGPG